MTAHGPRTLARAVLERLAELASNLMVQGTVTAFTTATPFTVTVALPGSADAMTVPRLKSYTAPAVGDVVWLAGPPGSWVCIGALA